MALSKITNLSITDDAVRTVGIQDDNVTLAKLGDGTQGDVLYYGASGAPARLGFGTSGDFLKTQGTGANPVWATAGGDNTPSFMVLNDAYISIPDSTNTALTFDTEIYDTDSAVSSGLFTCPSGKAGKYFFTTNGGMATGNDIPEVVWSISVNAQTSLASAAGDIVCTNYRHDGTELSQIIHSVSAVFNLSEADTVGVRVYQNFGGAKDAATDARCTFAGFKLT